MTDRKQVPCKHSPTAAITLFMAGMFTLITAAAFALASSQAAPASEIPPPSALQPSSAPQPAAPAESPYQVASAAPVPDGYFDDALFVGDSITSGISLYGVMAGAAVVSATGINPDSILTRSVIRGPEGELHTVLEAMAGHSPGKIYIQLGANGVGWLEKGVFIRRYAAFLDAVRQAHPDAAVAVQSIFPVTEEKSAGEGGIYANDKIDDYNRAMVTLCKQKGIPYLNVAEALKGEDGALPADASPDGMHLHPDYYQRWFDYLQSHPLPVRERS